MNESQPTPDAPTPTVTPRALAQALRSWHTAGVTHLARVALPQSDEPAKTQSPEPLASEPVPQKSIASGESAPPAPGPVATTSTKRPPATSASATERSAHPTTKEVASPARQVVQTSAAPEPQLPAGRDDHLTILARRVAQCTRCAELASTRKQTVFGVGNPQARVMFIGEAPGADEDKQGEPFVGKAGQLLNDIIAACGWKREELYICNILRCRPPNNRTPTDEEANNCREYLDGQISIVDPEYIVCWGSVAAKNLLHSDQSIGRLREQWFKYGRARVICTYHPSYLLRNPSAKRPVWEDMQRLLKEMGLTPPARKKS